MLANVTPFHLSVINRKIDIVKYINERNNVNIRNQMCLQLEGDEEENTAYSGLQNEKH